VNASDCMHVINPNALVFSTKPTCFPEVSGAIEAVFEGPTAHGRRHTHAAQTSRLGLTDKTLPLPLPPITNTHNTQDLLAYQLPILTSGGSATFSSPVPVQVRASLVLSMRPPLPSPVAACACVADQSERVFISHQVNAEAGTEPLVCALLMRCVRVHVRVPVCR
jgi:hypothetical protein